MAPFLKRGHKTFITNSIQNIQKASKLGLLPTSRTFDFLPTSFVFFHSFIEQYVHYHCLMLANVCNLVFNMYLRCKKFGSVCAVDRKLTLHEAAVNMHQIGCTRSVAQMRYNWYSASAVFYHFRQQRLSRAPQWTNIVAKSNRSVRCSMFQASDCTTLKVQDP